MAGAPINPLLGFILTSTLHSILSKSLATLLHHQQRKQWLAVQGMNPVTMTITDPSKDIENTYIVLLYIKNI